MTNTTTTSRPEDLLEFGHATSTSSPTAAVPLIQLLSSGIAVAANREPSLTTTNTNTLRGCALRERLLQSIQAAIIITEDWDDVMDDE